MQDKIIYFAESRFSHAGSGITRVLIFMAFGSRDCTDRQRQWASSHVFLLT